MTHFCVSSRLVGKQTKLKVCVCVCVLNSLVLCLHGCVCQVSEALELESQTSVSPYVGAEK